MFRWHGRCHGNLLKEGLGRACRLPQCVWPCAAAGEDLRHALDCTLAGKPLERRMKNSIGCNIKWHPGKAPAWFHG